MSYFNKVNEDYRVENDMCCFEAEERTTECRIVVIADGDAEEDETLHFKIVPTGDNCVCDDNLVVTIIKDVQREFENILLIVTLRRPLIFIFHYSYYGTVWRNTLQC